MGAVSNSIASAVQEYGGEIITNAPVKEIIVRQEAGDVAARGVRLADGSEVEAKVVISGANPNHTFLDLLSKHSQDSSVIPKEFINHISQTGAHHVISIHYYI